MLIRLLRSYLAPYRRPIAGLLLLSLAGHDGRIATAQPERGDHRQRRRQG